MFRKNHFKEFVFIATLVLLVSFVSLAAAQSEANADAAAAQLEAIAGTYSGLFAPVILQPEYDSIWFDYVAAVVGEADAQAVVDGLKNSVRGTLIGQAAVDAYGANPEETKFCCELTEEVSQLMFEGNRISGVNSAGDMVFSHEYSFLEYTPIGEETGLEGFGGYTFQSDDPDSGEYTYFLLLPDTPETTYHIELRYGSNLADLRLFRSGVYAYWLVGAIPVDATPAEIDKVIALFCLENMDYASPRSEGSLDQINKLIGTWEANVSLFPEEYADDSIRVTLGADGKAVGTIQGESAETAQIYIYDNDGDDSVDSGILVTWNEADGEFEALKFTLSEDGNTLEAVDLDGNLAIQYFRR